MEGNHQMGMVIIDSASGSIADFACEVEITECEPLPDGRFYLVVKISFFSHIQTFASYPFLLYNKEKATAFETINIRLKVAEDLASFDLGTKMGRYRVAEIEWVLDNPPEGLEQRTELLELTNSQSWLRRAKEAARQDRRRLEKLLNVEAMMPTPLDPERFSFWLATLTDRGPYERLELLHVRDAKEVPNYLQEIFTEWTQTMKEMEALQKNQT